jgi:hypothetical protein
VILYEAVVGQPLYPTSMGSWAIAKEITREEWEPKIPDSVLPETGKLICDCLTADDEERQSFSEILNRVERMRFKLIPGVNSSKVKEFVNQIKSNSRR